MQIPPGVVHRVLDLIGLRLQVCKDSHRYGLGFRVLVFKGSTGFLNVVEGFYDDVVWFK